VLLRSEYYGVFYALNDIVLIILWVLATIENMNYLPMVLCFAIFLINDLYGFYNWQRLKRKQNKDA
jgi:nicotinamide riboside transporter PnuC